MALYQKYMDAVTFLQKMQGETVSESGWKQMIPYGNSFSHTVQKGERGHCLITRTRNGEWYEETYEHGFWEDKVSFGHRDKGLSICH